jgi:hypothetical protein
MSVKIADVTVGTVLIPDADFDCLPQGVPVTVLEDELGLYLYLPCQKGRHYLDGQEEGDIYIGLSPHPTIENRRKWIELLKHPDTKKAQGVLVSQHDPEARCCLGHACHALDIPFDTSRWVYEGNRYTTPLSVIDALGLWGSCGELNDTSARVPGGQGSLAGWNDDTDTTPQEIGAYLETVIMGGDDTPFRPI